MKVGAVTSLPYRLNVPRRWIFWSVLLFAVTFAVGFLQKLLPALQWGTFNIALNPANSPFADWLARVLDSVNQVAVVAGILLIVVAVLGFGTRLGLLRGVGTCVAIGLGWVTTLAVKTTINQPRPEFHLPHPLDLEVATKSFPSGHVVFVAALVAGLVWATHRSMTRTILFVLGSILILTVAGWGLYGGVHYALDVIAGVLNGVAGYILVAGLWNLAAGLVLPSSGRH